MFSQSLFLCTSQTHLWGLICIHWIIAALEKTVNLWGSIMRLIYKNRAPQVHVCPKTKLQYLWEETIFKQEENKWVKFKKFPIDQVSWHRLLVTVSETVWSSTNPSYASLATSRSIMLSWCCKKLTYSEATPSAELEAGMPATCAGVGFTLRRNSRLIIVPRSFTPPSTAGKRPGQMPVQQIKRGELYQSVRVVANDIWEQHGNNTWPSRKDGDTHLLSWQEKENQPETKDNTHY